MVYLSSGIQENEVIFLKMAQAKGLKKYNLKNESKKKGK
jgi:hypothetical protein